MVKPLGTESGEGAPVQLDLATLGAGFAACTLSVAAVVESVLARLAAAGDDAVWIARVPDDALRARAAELDAAGPAGLPLFGVPFAVKDNIDVAGLPTTAACPAFAYMPERSAPAVQRLLDAGAVLVGKTNLDQFATGLVGVRSPYGVPRNPFDPAYIPGGSSSGSAVAVSAGLVSFALGTDTAGSGRVPAGFTNIVGLKPTKGLIPTAGVLPACRTLDCVSVFALTVADAAAVLGVAAGPAAEDPFSRTAPPGFDPRPALLPSGLRVGVPRADQLRFFGNADAERLFAVAVGRIEALGARVSEIDFAPFEECASLLYGGAWVAERTHTLRSLLADDPEAMHPVVRRIVEGGKTLSAVDAFDGIYRLEEAKRRARPVWESIDLLLVPTSGTIYRVAEVEADPIALNANLGIYTNFTNLMDLAGLAVPNGFQGNGLPAGVTLLGPAWSEGLLASVGAAFHAATGLPLGATGAPQPATEAVARPAGGHPGLPVAVFGAHLSGMGLNGELAALGARLLRPARTRAEYRLYRLPGLPPRPGLLRVVEGGAAIDTEVWEIPAAAVARFLTLVPAPLGIGRVRLEDGSTVHGFLCEAAATAGAEDITAYGGWRAYTTAQAPSV